MTLGNIKDGGAASVLCFITFTKCSSQARGQQGITQILGENVRSLPLVLGLHHGLVPVRAWQKVTADHTSEIC